MKEFVVMNKISTIMQQQLAYSSSLQYRRVVKDANI